MAHAACALVKLTGKAGKFVPNFGTKLDDHTAFVRTYTGFSPEIARPELTGIEAAVSPGGLTLMGGFYNATDGFGAASGNTKAFLGRAEYMWSPSEGVHLMLGGNVFANGLLRVPVAYPAGSKQAAYGGFGSLSVGQLTLLGEADWVRSTGGGALVAKAFILYGEADYPVVQGVDLKVMYDFLDPDTEFKTGTASRFSVGVEFFPLPGVELRPLYRVVQGEFAGLKNELDVMLHLYF